MSRNTQSAGGNSKSRGRRRILQAIGLAGLGGLAGCTGDDEVDDDPGDDDPGDDDPGDDDPGDDDPGDEESEPEAFFEVTALDPEELTIESGGSVTVTATIENTGDGEGTQDVEFRIDGDGLASESLTLEAGAETDLAFEGVETGDLEPGEYQFSVATADDEHTGSLVIEEAEEVDLVTLVSQPTHNNVPEDVRSAGGDPGLGSVADTYGQTFTVEEAFDVVELHVANYGNPDAVATLTLFRGDPLEDGDLEELASETLDWPDNEEISVDWAVEEGGTYYFEMSEPEHHATWFWYELPFGEDGDEDAFGEVGGEALLDRAPAADAGLRADDDTHRDEPVEQANFRFSVKQIQ